MSILLKLPISEEVRVTYDDVHLVRKCRHQNLGERSLPCRDAVSKCAGVQMEGANP